MKKKRRLRKGVYDFIINICLFGAIFCLLIGSNSYIKNYKDDNAIDVVKQVFLNSPLPSHQATIEEPLESTTNIEINVSEVITNYIESIKDRIITDDMFPYEEVKTWQSYSINDILFIKEITDNYYEYTINLYLNKNYIVSLDSNNELSTEEYNVISLKVYILEKDNTYQVKKIDVY